MPSSDTSLESPASEFAPGKRQLLQAALRLCCDSRSLSSLGLRELAREAGLNPNTFYRHFSDIDDLGLTLIRDIGTQLRGPLRALRQQAAARAKGDNKLSVPRLFGINLIRSRRVVHETVQLFFDFVDQQPEAFIVGIRERYGASPALRQALSEVMNGFAADMREDIRDLKLMPAGISDSQLAVITEQITHHLFQMALDYLSTPARQHELRQQAEAHILMLASGAAVLQRLGQLRL